ncbi:hemerythrin domain-containing protein [Streptomyces sp. NRRL S-87]|uniref:hemerythrin domain-containing protein n=1 Tax=Streptomyces sp. NRRL S-87 TaxID=1463920 RepID=UPI0004C2780E|nr:hemerythrin domain-containing protein [Streptomyces sp. NRRL S-87]
MSTDAIVMLRDDHKRLRRLIRDYRSADGGPSAPPGTRRTAADPRAEAQAVEEFLHLLTVHTFLDEEVVYPRVRRLAPDTQETLLELHEEHHVADVLARELSGMDAGDEAYGAKTRVLMAAVERHMEMEEDGWFPQVRRAVGRKELQAVGARMAEVREQAPRQPHRPLLDKVVDAFAAT